MPGVPTCLSTPNTCIRNNFVLKIMEFYHLNASKQQICHIIGQKWHLVGGKMTFCHLPLNEKKYTALESRFDARHASPPRYAPKTHGPQSSRASSWLHSSEGVPVDSACYASIVAWRSVPGRRGHGRSRCFG